MSEAKTPPRAGRTGEEVVRLGKELYEREIRQKVEDEHPGKIISIDVESGDWEIGKSVVETTDRLWERRPAACDIYSLTIGDEVLYRFGGGPVLRRMR